MASKKKQSAENLVRDSGSRTRRKFSPEEKIRIVLEGLVESWPTYLFIVVIASGAVLQAGLQVVVLVLGAGRGPVQSERP